MERYFDIKLSGWYDNREVDYGIYGESYGRGTAGSFSGEALLAAASPEEAKEIAGEKVRDTLGDDGCEVRIEVEEFDTDGYTEEEIKGMTEFRIHTEEACI